ncbi:TPA: hypothetical protein ACPSKE_000887 [Legionella feeleii]|uniref:Transmembrane protein n=1 Tax=Legionella feeleii TaxID=453 RepID=A0A0W0TV58_9GAMM|nr:hypothetical protein [Legionella feeleii]KTC99291.1 hypothetical protein Lfee_1457 [Legionella feeleii]SPX62644.1 Uncharacterised protein [Legionella feeleii]
MFGFFNRENKLRALMQALNTAALFVALSEMASDPEHAWEWGLDALTCFVSILALVEKPSPLSKAGSVSLNFMCLGAVFNGVTSGCSVLPNLTNLFKAAALLGNIVIPVATAERQPAQVPQVTL